MAFRPEDWAQYRAVNEKFAEVLLEEMEFVSVRDDGDGVLILSRFTGAARELRDAILVNPYDLDETADAIRAALEMPPAERSGRMGRMRRYVREHNIYRWAGMLVGDLARIPQEAVVPRAS